MIVCPLMSGVDLDGKLVKVECIKHECAQYINVIGLNPQTGQEVNQWDCSHSWTPLLLIENSQQQRQTGAAVESLRNVVDSDSKKVLALAEKNQLALAN